MAYQNVEMQAGNETKHSRKPLFLELNEFFTPRKLPAILYARKLGNALTLNPGNSLTQKPMQDLIQNYSDVDLWYAHDFKDVDCVKIQTACIIILSV